jgi:hypothetical protein
MLAAHHRSSSAMNQVPRCGASMILHQRRVVVSRDVVFDVMASWTTKDEEMDPSGDFILEFHTLKIGSEHKGAPEPIVGMSTLSPAALALEPMTPAPAASPPPQPEFV